MARRGFVAFVKRTGSGRKLGAVEFSGRTVWLHGSRLSWPDVRRCSIGSSVEGFSLAVMQKERLPSVDPTAN